MRIRNWKFVVKEVLEMVPKSLVISCATEKAKLEDITKKITEFGFSSSAVQHLRVSICDKFFLYCVIIFLIIIKSNYS